MIPWLEACATLVFVRSSDILHTVTLAAADREAPVPLVWLFIHSETGSRIFAGCQLLTSTRVDNWPSGYPLITPGSNWEAPARAGVHYCQWDAGDDQCTIWGDTLSRYLDDVQSMGSPKGTRGPYSR
jgi:hypothetical protein